MKIAAERAVPLRLPGSPVPVPFPHQLHMPSNFALQELRGACLEELDQVGWDGAWLLLRPAPNHCEVGACCGCTAGALHTKGTHVCRRDASMPIDLLSAPATAEPQVEADLDAEQKEDDDLRWVWQQGRQGRGSVAAHCSCAAAAAAHWCAGSELAVFKQAAAVMALLTNTGMSPDTWLSLPRHRHSPSGRTTAPAGSGPPPPN